MDPGRSLVQYTAQRRASYERSDQELRALSSGLLATSKDGDWTGKSIWLFSSWKSFSFHPVIYLVTIYAHCLFLPCLIAKSLGPYSQWRSFRYWKAVTRSSQRLLCWQGTALAHVQLVIYKNPPVLFSRGPPQSVNIFPVLLQGFLLSQGQDFAFLEFCKVPVSQVKPRKAASPLLGGAGHLVTRHMEKVKVLNALLVGGFTAEACSQASQVSQTYKQERSNTLSREREI